MIKYICDCCGKEIKKGEIKQIKVHDNYTNRVEKEGIHWCKDCVSNNGKPGFNFPILDTSEIEFEIELEKLKEEVCEFITDKNEEELADIFEVIEHIITAFNFNKEKILEIKKKKVEKNGKFNKKIILEKVFNMER